MLFAYEKGFTMRLILRLFLLIYFVMPVLALLLIGQIFIQFQNDVAPVYEAASTRIMDASTVLENELMSLGRNFAPLENAIIAIRNALQTLLNFVRDTIYTIIDVVNGINLACSVGGAACIPKSINLTLPPLVDLSFIDNISTQVSTISSEMYAVIETTSAAVTSYTTLLIVALGVFILWIILSFILFYAMLYRGLVR